MHVSRSFPDPRTILRGLQAHGRKVVVFAALIPLASFLGIAGIVYSGQEADDSFTIAILPDTQYYTSEKNGGTKEMFDAQTEWIAKNAAKEKIAYVVHLGDISDNGEQFPVQWEYASKSMYRLEQPQPGYPQGIPYGMAVGNHDQTRSQYPLSGVTAQYNKYFGIEHFKGRKWYGGHYRNDNDSHYDLVDAGAVKLIFLYLEYDSYDEDTAPMNEWAGTVLKKYSDRKAVLVSHSITHLNKTPGTNRKAFPKFTKQGQRIIDRLKFYPNVFLALSGHVGDNGEGFRQDGLAGRIIHSLLSDYQSRPQGGHGLMRLMKFSPSKDLITVRTFSPVTGEEERDGDSEFSFPWVHHTNAARFMDLDNDQLSDVASFTDGSIKNISGLPDSLKPAGMRAGDVPSPADYDGDGRTELAFFRPSEGVFYLPSGITIRLGRTGDVPVSGDWDGDGFADAAVYRAASALWLINGQDSIRFGGKTTIPVPADYDGDGIMDVGVFNPGNSMWSTSLGNIPLQLRQPPGDIPVPADYDGDGRIEQAVFRAFTGEWIIDRHLDKPIKFGQPGDVPVPGNYEKGGKAMPAVFRSGKIYLLNGKVLETGAAKATELFNLLPSVRWYLASTGVSGR